MKKIPYSYYKAERSHNERLRYELEDMRQDVRIVGALMFICGLLLGTFLGMVCL